MVAGFNESLLDLGHSRGAVAEISAEETRAARLMRLGRPPGRRGIGWTTATPSNTAAQISRLTDALARSNPLEWRLMIEPFLKPEHAGGLARPGEKLAAVYAESIF